MMEQCKTYLETAVGYDVIGGFISPSSDLYVQPKMKHLSPKGQPLEATFASAAHRIRLVEKAVQSSPWLSCATWEAKQPHFRDFDEVQYALDEFLRQNEIFTSTVDKVFYVCGSDHFQKCGLHKGIYCRDDRKIRSVAVVSRCEENDSTLSNLSSFSEDVVIIPSVTGRRSSTNCPPLSSTKVRELLNAYSLSAPEVRCHEQDKEYSSSSTATTELERKVELEKLLREMLPVPVLEDVMGMNKDGIALYCMT